MLGAFRERIVCQRLSPLGLRLHLLCRLLGFQNNGFLVCLDVAGKLQLILRHCFLRMLKDIGGDAPSKMKTTAERGSKIKDLIVLKKQTNLSNIAFYFSLIISFGI
jgi:hypothetical protein